MLTVFPLARGHVDESVELVCTDSFRREIDNRSLVTDAGFGLRQDLPQRTLKRTRIPHQENAVANTFVGNLMLCINVAEIGMLCIFCGGKIVFKILTYYAFYEA
jgi:hypothetical protein